MSKILIVLPFSGRAFGGGLAVFNQEFTKALRANGHEVKLLTLTLTDTSREANITARSDDHGGATIISLNDAPIVLKNPRGIDAERESLYQLINHPDHLFANKAALLEKIQGSGHEWVPDIVIGHSRFSGPAAILLKTQCFGEARTIYFLHSYPVEGTILTGYNVYNEPIDTISAARKIEKEGEWMKRSDVVVPVGAFLRAGVMKLLGGASVRVHECIGGTDATERPARFTDPGTGTRKLLFNGRANAPIKGLEDILLAAQKLRDDEACPPIELHVRFWETKAFYEGKQVNVESVQSFADGVVLLNGKPGKVTVKVGGSTPQIMDEVRSSHGVLMPSYIEHFGLVPVEALGVDVPVLVNEISGAGMFLADRKRFGEAGARCVVHDFYKRVSPTRPDDFLEPSKVPETAFDARPVAWAKAIKALVTDLPSRFAEAHTLGETLRHGYTWQHCAAAVVLATAVPYGKCAVTQQGPDGVLWDIDGDPV